MARISTENQALRDEAIRNSINNLLPDGHIFTNWKELCSRFSWTSGDAKTKKTQITLLERFATVTVITGTQRISVVPKQKETPPTLEGKYQPLIAACLQEHFTELAASAEPHAGQVIYKSDLELFEALGFVNNSYSKFVREGGKITPDLHQYSEDNNLERVYKLCKSSNRSRMSEILQTSLKQLHTRKLIIYKETFLVARRGETTMQPATAKEEASITSLERLVLRKLNVTSKQYLYSAGLWGRFYNQMRKQLVDCMEVNLLDYSEVYQIGFTKYMVTGKTTGSKEKLNNTVMFTLLRAAEKLLEAKTKENQVYAVGYKLGEDKSLADFFNSWKIPEYYVKMQEGILQKHHGI